MRVLIVEDVPEMAELIKIMLDRPEFELVSVLTALDARVDISRNRPEVVLLDSVLPGESAQNFAQDCHQMGIPVVWMSATPGAATLLKPTWETYLECADQFTQAFKLTKHR